MTEHPNALLALKNAWSGVVAANERLRELESAVVALPADTPVEQLDLNEYHGAVSAHATAVMALRGLIEELQRRRQPAG
jgi:hypothetical protein